MRRSFRWLLLVLISTTLAGCGGLISDESANVRAVAETSPSPSAMPEPTATSAPPSPSATPEPSAPPAPPSPSPSDAAATPVSPEHLANEVNDTAELSVGAAPPTLQQTPTPTGDVSKPVRLVIPDINLNKELLAVGLNKHRVPIVPKHDVGWYEYSAVPSQGDNIVLWGHVSRWKDSPNIPAPFARVKELDIGDDIWVYTADGKKHRYKVTEAVQVRPSQVQYILPTGKERLTLVSCIGDRVILEGQTTREFRLVTMAEPAP